MANAIPIYIASSDLISMCFCVSYISLWPLLPSDKFHLPGVSHL